MNWTDLETLPRPNVETIARTQGLRPVIAKNVRHRRRDRTFTILPDQVDRSLMINYIIDALDKRDDNS